MRYSAMARQMTRTPWEILPEKLYEIVEVVRRRAVGVEIPEAQMREIAEQTRQRQRPRQVDRVAVIPVVGVLINRSIGEEIENASGLVAYKTIQAKVQAALDDDEVGAVVLDVDSPGGTAEGVHELSEFLRRAREIKPLLAAVDGTGASGAFHVAAQASFVSMARSSRVGSVGVITVHENIQGSLEQQGVELTLITAGQYKDEGNPFEPLDESARAELQREVDAYYDLFLEDLSAGRRIGRERVEADFGQGRLLRADDALRAGMVDAIATTEATIVRALGSLQRRELAESIEDVRTFERFLREAGFSKARARQIAASGFTGRRDAAQSKTLGDALREIADRHLH